MISASMLQLLMFDSNEADGRECPLVTVMKKAEEVFRQATIKIVLEDLMF